ncbi:MULTISPECIES: response regulator [unclassified Pseudomonas]|uniref:response regulator n=1 Tax=unclassified Pseudomonas TaxID=196821 RepID=UPI00087722B4|nr:MULTISPECIES: response regulator [unclassified Pseudomonas]MDB6443904.1 response regulator [Pseudomonas sp. 21TX0197]ROO31652.1 response regulator [Pseudomonas sp. 7SR1]SCX43313.1 Response regulator receiver domain-containing protein [Pseudomonas sp. NFACC32-1]SFX10364.1 Response regulator receiver domain-containing protein [Pseudomonas sp. NFACC43]SFX10932.1 Response regulator receiver domain-containing protein [Pseudomonas sp. NFACC47-1]
MNSMPNGNGQATTRLILVVEDDPTILEFLCEILEDEGFVVEPRESADSALTFLEQSADYVDLLLTDITMPGTIDGADLANMTGDRWPQIPLLIMSGYETPESAGIKHHASFIAKPWALGQMLDLVESTVKNRQVH